MAEAARKFQYDNHIPANLEVHKKRIRKKSVKKTKRRNIFLTFVYTSFLLISIASAIFILSNYQKITALNFEIDNLNAIMVESEKTEMNLNAKIEEVKSDVDIVHEAKTKLGMVFPESDQVVYFSLEDSNSGEESFISSIFSTFTGNNE